MSQSADNLLKGISETTRNGIVENIKFISDHVPKHSKFNNDQELGYYLAGLIDGDGHFSSAQQLVIIFSQPDVFLAYYLKEKIGYGNVKKVKDKKAYLLIISKKMGIVKIINLINGKLRTENKYNQVIGNILSHYPDLKIDFNMNLTNDFNNH
jgi:hypothetical protein